ncbi:hypothetical protein PPYR_04433 [Photinus pyralis]|uniref:DUF1279 domain-containing protein n=1 Tax=Photinus pyralis TaxID=7054 RepID=A0A5N4AY31_PHOPY|nr:protein FAM210B, mitochondrial-like [Photinus pyralis]KAB0802247.1 hypothetical protein PPYR_04433 [Photinus pyralis]
MYKTIYRAFNLSLNLPKTLNHGTNNRILSIATILKDYEPEPSFRSLHVTSYKKFEFCQYPTCSTPSNFLLLNSKHPINFNRFCSTSKKGDQPVEPTKKEKLKRAVKEYGSTVVIFHVTISLASLGVCYLLVSSGLDMSKILAYLGISGSIAANAGTFVTAYAIHKVFAPVRISITLGATPFIVSYLRRIGFLKVKSPKN